ncbi:hypothetical protein DWZ07_08895 [Streptococcus salivarius]|uniref:hypothetical protein n=1 Tax=Streptococcus salivarius TaxID=1304 RepID=UPI000E4CA0EC|nr:hypothetical protein [Streptococcus salivarius]RGQ12989.1 hypothetical protein DWZ07_08895 [Streptococcus salivarius]
MLYIFTVIFCIILVIYQFKGRKTLEKQFDKYHDSWGILEEQKSQYLKTINFDLNLLFISLTLLSLGGVIFNISIYDYVIFAYIIIFVYSIISQFELAIVGYEWYDIKSDTPFRIWNYLAFKGEAKRNWELWGIFLPNPTNTKELTKVEEEIQRLSSYEKQKIIESLKTSKFRRVSNKTNWMVMNCIVRIRKWLFTGITATSIIGFIIITYFNGNARDFLHLVFSNSPIIIAMIVILFLMYKFVLFMFDEYTTKNRKRYAKEKLFELFEIEK